MNEQSILQYQRKVKTVDELCALIGPRPRQKKVIMCHGTFDIVHPGHVRHLIYAKSKGEILVASVTADAHISKANVRPYVPEDLRAVNLAAFEMVDYVLIDKNHVSVRVRGDKACRSDATLVCLFRQLHTPRLQLAFSSPPAGGTAGPGQSLLQSNLDRF